MFIISSDIPVKAFSADNLHILHILFQADEKNLNSEVSIEAGLRKVCRVTAIL